MEEGSASGVRTHFLFHFPYNWYSLIREVLLVRRFLNQVETEWREKYFGWGWEFPMLPSPCALHPSSSQPIYYFFSRW
jgi:hypothetical protein